MRKLNDINFSSNTTFVNPRLTRGGGGDLKIKLNNKNQN